AGWDPPRRRFHVDLCLIAKTPRAGRAPPALVSQLLAAARSDGPQCPIRAANSCACEQAEPPRGKASRRPTVRRRADTGSVCPPRDTIDRCSRHRRVALACRRPADVGGWFVPSQAGSSDAGTPGHGDLRIVPTRRPVMPVLSLLRLTINRSVS